MTKKVSLLEDKQQNIQKIHEIEYNLGPQNFSKF